MSAHRSSTQIAILRIHHHAARSRDPEKTRAFYEDLLGLPLMATFVEMDTAGEPEGITRSYMHVFYALPDGSALAFFTLEQDLHGAQPVEAINSFHHHLALEVANLDAVNEVRNRYERAGQTHRVIDHGYCYSLYSSDPDGLTVEVTCNVPATREIMDERKKTAHEDMRAWVGGARHLNNHWRHPAAT